MDNPRALIARLAFGLILGLGVGVAPAASEAAAAKPDPRNGVWSLVLEEAIQGKPLTILLSSRDGKWIHAVGTAFTYNRSIHAVDASGLRPPGDGLKGAIRVTINPDAWVPEHGKTVSCEFQVEAVGSDGAVTGTYKGTVGGAAVAGRVGGTLEAPGEAVRSGTVELRLENALTGGAPHLCRANVRIGLADGKTTNGRISCFDPRHWQATVEDLKVALTADALTGEIKAAVRSGPREVSEGTYTFTLDGKVVGTLVAGTFKARRGDKELPGGTFAGTIKAGAQDTAAGEARTPRPVERGAAEGASASRPEDEVDDLVRRLKPPARFEGYKPDFSVEEWTFTFQHVNGPVQSNWLVVMDGEKYVALVRSGDFNLLALTPDMAKTTLEMPKGRYHLDTQLGPTLCTHQFLKGVKVHGSIYGDEMAQPEDRWEGGGETLTLVRSVRGDDRIVRHRFTFRVDPVHGYEIVGRYEVRFKEPPTPKDQFVGPTFCPGCYTLWPETQIYERTVYCAGAGQAAYRGWANNLIAMDRGDAWGKCCWRDRGFIAYLDKDTGWSPCRTRVDGGGDVYMPVCNAHNDFHVRISVPKDLAQDENGWYVFRATHRLLALPPELTRHVWDNMELFGKGQRAVMIRIGVLEDFEDQPVSVTEPVRGLTWTSGGPPVTTEEARSGRKSVLLTGTSWPNLPQCSLLPETKYRLEAWYKVRNYTEEEVAVAKKKDAERRERLASQGEPLPPRKDFDKLLARAYIKGDFYEWSPHSRKWLLEQQTNVVTAEKDGWQQVSLEFTTPKWDPFINVVFVVEDGKAYLDDFRLIRLNDKSSDAPGPAAPESGRVLRGEPQARAEAIQRTLAAIDRELRERGGWEPWAEQLKPFREDLTRIMPTKWPWRAKHDFVFQGRAIQVLLMDDLDDQPEGQRPFDGIVHFDRQLKARGIDLIVMPIPSKLAVYPDHLSDKAPEDRLVSLSVKRLMKRLLENDVEVIDLYTTFRDFRREHEEKAPLYYVRDSHWMNLGARMAAERIAERLQRYDFVQLAMADDNPYTGEKASRHDKPDPDLLFIRDKKTGAFYKDVPDSPIVLTGDSYSMYNMGKAHLPAQVALRIARPLTFMCGEGLGPGMPVTMAQAEKGKGYLRGRRVVVWTFTGRFFKSKQPAWHCVTIPQPAGAGKLVRNVLATGVVSAFSPPAPKNPPYPNYIMKLYVTGLADESAKPVGEGEGVVRVLALRAGKVLPIAGVKKGRRLKARLTSWSAVENLYGKIMTGTLDRMELELDKPHYWGELVPE